MDTNQGRNACDDSGCISLSCAASCEQESIVKLVLKSGQVNVYPRDNSNRLIDTKVTFYVGMLCRKTIIVSICSPVSQKHGVIVTLAVTDRQG